VGRITRPALREIALTEAKGTTSRPVFVHANLIWRKQRADSVTTRRHIVLHIVDALP
jgi:hypothetical protein